MELVVVCELEDVEDVDVVLVEELVEELDEKVVVPVDENDVDVDVDVDVDEAGGVDVVVAAHGDTATVLPFIVTAPSCANAAPFMLAPEFRVMLVKAIILPTNDVLVPSVAELPTAQNTLHA